MYFILKCNWENKTWKVFFFFFAPEFGRSNPYIGLPNGLNTSLINPPTHQISNHSLTGKILIKGLDNVERY